MKLFDFIRSYNAAFVLFFITLTTTLLLALSTESIPSRGLEFTSKITEEKLSAAPANSASSKYSAQHLPRANPNLDYKEIDADLFPHLIETAKSHPRGRKMCDLTKDPTSNDLQTLLNTWIEGSYSPVHKHFEYAEVLLFFLLSIPPPPIMCILFLRLDFCRVGRSAGFLYL